MTLDDIDDATQAAAFRRLVQHLRHRHDAENIDLMGLSGFCRNCLGDWLAEESGGAFDRQAGREAVLGMAPAEWKSRYQGEASPEQIERMNASLKKNEGRGF
ncbi:DUF1244 domain-containing protein [Sphingomonas naphthae]|uniref:DUF1244 domain-containing protein n=1 Tax=Sphingomonas naphthae TaxID=1813468 RepID=A0ABY7TJH8_9SPHN|nr:DUF1244 domain-containing protein [Sphingomonas naphthae]WCT72565.1 DUF1244 domain-containing protein [Sphingomonas naphthae]